MGEASSIAELTVEDIQSQLNESEKLQLTSNTQPPRFLLGLKSTEANINEPFVFTVKGQWFAKGKRDFQSMRTKQKGCDRFCFLPP